MEEKLTPGMLTALPNLKGPYFEKTVILMINYTKEGAFGLIMNTPSSARVKDILRGNIDLNDGFDMPLLIGGPVQPESFWAVHSNDFEGETTTRISPRISLSAAQDVLLAISTHSGPKICHMGCGYSGWGPEQLDQEIQNESWWLSPLDETTIMEMPYPERWEKTLAHLGLNPIMASCVKTGLV
jgi:putative transcriptional regulator